MARHAMTRTMDSCCGTLSPWRNVGLMRGALEAQNAELAVAKTGDQAHPVFCLMRREVHASLAAFLASGQRKIDRWYASHRFIEVAFDDEADAFLNINTREELSSLEPPKG